ncbi:hypothetical protein [Psychrobacillus psychrodurans]|nr:hypothetical protein [Psychrobacillus psychrodurans]
MIKSVTGFWLVPKSFMLGISFTGDSIEIFLGPVALSIEIN